MTKPKREPGFVMSFTSPDSGAYVGTIHIDWYPRWFRRWGKLTPTISFEGSVEKSAKELFHFVITCMAENEHECCV